METRGPLALLKKPLFRVAGTWAWWFLGAALTVWLILAVQGFPLSSALSTLGEKRYLAVYIEIVSVGLLPVVVSLLCRDNLAEYGLTRKGLAGSLLWAALVVVTLFGWAYLTQGRLMTDDRPPLQVAFPWNLWYGLLGIVAWGPLEVFFVTWLIANTDALFKDRHRLISGGLVTTIIAFAALHVLTTNFANALYTGFIFLILALIFKRTGNALGPMLAWTLINGQVWYIARLLA